MIDLVATRNFPDKMEINEIGYRSGTDNIAEVWQEKRTTSHWRNSWAQVKLSKPFCPRWYVMSWLGSIGSNEMPSTHIISTSALLKHNICGQYSLRQCKRLEFQFNDIVTEVAVLINNTRAVTMWLYFTIYHNQLWGHLKSYSFKFMPTCITLLW